MRKTKCLSWGMLLVFTLSIFCGFGTPNVMAAGQINDIQGHWAAAHISTMVEKGIATGYPDNTFKPDANVSRAEFITLTNKTFGFTDSAEAQFKDVKTTDWFAGQIAIAKKAAYISGYEDGTIRPNNQISRQEAAVIIAKILELDTKANAEVLNKFTDSQSIPSWSKGSVAALVNATYMTGYPDQTFKADRSITRAEAAVILSKAKGIEVITEAPANEFSNLDQAGTYGPAEGTQTIDGDVTISADGVNLQNVIIKGKLLISEAVGEGDVKLTNVTVEDTTTINGGGENSVTLENCTLGKVIVNKDNNKLRVALTEKTTIAELVINSAAKVTGKDAAIKKATINHSGVSIETQPTNTTIKSGLSAVIAGNTRYASSGGGGGSSSSGSTAVKFIDLSKSDVRNIMPGVNQIRVFLLSGTTDDYTIKAEGLTFKARTDKDGWYADLGAATGATVTVTRNSDNKADSKAIGTTPTPVDPTPGTLVDTAKSDVRNIMPGVNQIRVFLISGTTDDYTIEAEGLTFKAKTDKDGWYADLGAATGATVTVTRNSDKVFDSQTIGNSTPVDPDPVDPTPGSLIDTSKSDVRNIMPGVNQIRVFLLSGTTDDYTIEAEGLTFKAKTDKDGWYADLGAATSAAVTVTRTSDQVFDTQTIN